MLPAPASARCPLSACAAPGGGSITGSAILGSLCHIAATPYPKRRHPGAQVMLTTKRVQGTACPGRWVLFC